MGSIQDFHETLISHQNGVKREHSYVEKTAASLVGSEGFRALKITDLATDLTLNPTGMKDEIVLLSWLIVLLRTREEGIVSYEWNYQCNSNGIEYNRKHESLSTDQIIPDLQNTVEQATTSIAGCITTDALGQNAYTGGPASLILSTSSLSQTAEKSNDEVS
jgi:fusarinine C synthase